MQVVISRPPPFGSNRLLWHGGWLQQLTIWQPRQPGETVGNRMTILFFPTTDGGHLAVRRQLVPPTLDLYPPLAQLPLQQKGEWSRIATTRNSSFAFSRLLVIRHHRHGVGLNKLG